MSYISLSHAVVQPAEDYINEQMNSSHLSTKAAHLGLATLSLLTTSADTLIGLGAGFCAILIPGKKGSEIFQFSRNNVHLSKHILLTPYRHLMAIVNPDL